jgi:hypothetical protein
VKELSKQITKPSIKAESQKNQWKYKAPTAGASMEKQVDEKMFWCCTGLDGKNLKPMLCCHKPQDCKEQGKSKQVSLTDAVNNETKPKMSAPKLKPNNNMATALAALDGVLKKSTNSDQEETSDMNFQ